MRMIEEFLVEAFSDAPGDVTISWPVANKFRSSHWPTDGIGRSAELIDDLAEDYDVYIGPATRQRGLPRWRRGGLSDLAAQVGLFADLDIAGPSHKLEGYPSRRAVWDLLDRLPPSSALIFTGGGFHAWWLFKEHYLVGEDGSAFDLRDIVVSFTLGLTELLGKRLDPQEPAKVLRVPGTVNHKFDPPRPVKVVQTSGERYTVDELLAAVPKVDARAPRPSDSRVSHPYSRRRSSVLDYLPDQPGLVEWLLIERLGFEHHRTGADGAWYLTHEDHQSQRPGTPAAVWRSYGVPVLVIHSEGTAAFLGLPSGTGRKLTLARLWAHLDFGGDVGALASHLSSTAGRRS